jgi:hypothetical protein
MNAKELYTYIGRRGLVELGGVKVRVEITDAKVSYGNARFLITPIAGNGVVWVDSARVVLNDQWELVDKIASKQS